ncbi:MAG TPA: NAD(P)H-quinone oxidoreductase [Frankiaceae bacterium]|jgi:putative PIG3 family NAD(P)H quinone oxidoreductase|nr:NAD(P)H-quinone oxidoreductase [Frankiaceae bacterium]
MRAVVLDGYGGPEVLRVADVDDPVPGPGEVLLDVAATAVNRADTLQRQGFYPPPPGASDVIGLECAGTVAALGEGVTGPRVGDEVCALLAGGGYATRVAVPAAQCLPVPRGLDLVTAASLPEAACTVWSNVVMTARLKRGETLLVHGGASGIGTMAIQLGKRLDARVVVTARAAKHDACRALGADETVDYETEDFAEKVRADVILDILGAKYLARNVAALNPNGRLVVIGLQGGTKAELDLGALLAKRGTVVATSLRYRPLAEKADIVREVRANVWPLVETGAVKPVVDRVLDLDDVAEAHRVLAAGEHVGKIVLRCA